jgi:hypothetical protein
MSRPFVQFGLTSHINAAAPKLVPAGILSRCAKEAMMKPMIAVLMLLLAAAPVHAAGLDTDAHVTEKLVAAQVGDILRNTCPTISARRLTVLSEMFALERHAKAAGNTDAEIRAFLKNKTEKKRIKTLALAYLKKAGAVAGDVDSYCTVARAEIAAKTTAGKLLR